MNRHPSTKLSEKVYLSVPLGLSDGLVHRCAETPGELDVGDPIGVTGGHLVGAAPGGE